MLVYLTDGKTRTPQQRLKNDAGIAQTLCSQTRRQDDSAVFSAERSEIALGIGPSPQHGAPEQTNTRIPAKYELITWSARYRQRPGRAGCRVNSRNGPPALVAASGAVLFFVVTQVLHEAMPKQSVIVARPERVWTISTPLILCPWQEARWVVPGPRPPKDGISNPVRSSYDSIRWNLIPLLAREDFKGMVFKFSPFRGFEPHPIDIIAGRLASRILERTEPF